jgi:hypothetical protein
VYSHLWPDSDDRTRDAVDAVLGTVADSVRTVEGGKSQIPNPRVRAGIRRAELRRYKFCHGAAAR